MSDENETKANVSSAEEVLFGGYVDVLRNGLGVAERGVGGLTQVRVGEVRSLDGVFLPQLVELRQRVARLEDLVSQLVGELLKLSGGGEHRERTQ